MQLTYDPNRDVLEILWCTEPGEWTAWRRARANIDLRVNLANEATGISISAASWLCPELQHVHVALDAELTLQSWTGYRPPPPCMTEPSGEQLLARMNPQPQLPWPLRAPAPAAGAKGARGICRYCGSVATDRRAPAHDGWPAGDICAECSPTAAPQLQRMIEPLRPTPPRTPNPHTGPRGRSDRPPAPRPQNPATWTDSTVRAEHCRWLPAGAHRTEAPCEPLHAPGTAESLPLARDTGAGRPAPSRSEGMML